MITPSNQPGGRMTGGRALAEMLRLHEVGPMFGMAASSCCHSMRRCARSGCVTI